MNSQRQRMQSENADLSRQLEESEHRVSVLSKDKASLAAQLEEAKRSLEEEARVSCLIVNTVFPH